MTKSHHSILAAPDLGAAWRSVGLQGGDPSEQKRDQENAWLDEIHVVSEDIVQEPQLAKSLDAELGALVNAIVCQVGDEPVLVLMAGDMPCDPHQVARVRNARGVRVHRMSLKDIKGLCGEDAVTAMFPVALSAALPTIMDASLQRFEALYTHAGSRSCFMRTTYGELKAATRATVSYALCPPDWRLKIRAK